MQDFKQLRLWQLAREFVSDIYKATETFPKHEFHSMVNQLRRASYSIPSNIAEGSGKGGKEFARYLSIVSGSIKEVECFLILAKDLNYLDNNKFEQLIEKIDIIGKMNNKLMSNINRGD